MDNRQKHAYLIMAHDNFEQLSLLIRALDNPRVDIYIHIDANSDYKEFESLISVAHFSMVKVFSKFKIFWADYSQTECELYLFEQASAGQSYAYYHLISNADFPTMPQDKILEFFDRNQGKEFISFCFPKNIWPFNNKPYTTEIKYYHVLSHYYRTKNKLLNRVVYCIEYFLVFIQFLLRIDRIKGQYIPAKGSNWISVTDDFVRYILEKKDFIQRNFKYTRSAEEVFPAILAYNNERFRNNLYDHEYNCSTIANQRYIDWKRGFPYTFRIEDYDEIISSGLPFVRKVDMRKDNGLVLKLFHDIVS